MNIADTTNVLFSTRLLPVFIQQGHSKSISTGLETIFFDKPTGTGQTILLILLNHNKNTWSFVCRVNLGKGDI